MAANAKSEKDPRTIYRPGDLTTPVTIGAPGHGGVCIAHPEGVTTFVRGAINGETGRIRITHTRKKIAFGYLAEVTDPSPQRVSHIWDQVLPAPTRGADTDFELLKLGVADLGHVDYPAQAEWKSHVLKFSTRNLPGYRDGLDVRVEQVEETGVRQRLRAEVEALPEGGIAMHVPGTDRLIEVTDSPLTVPALMPALASYAEANRNGQRRLRAVSAADGVRIMDGERVVNIRGRESGPTVRYRVGEDRYQCHVGDFWQPHALGAQIIRDCVEAFLAPDNRTGLELFCGSGLLTVALARHLDSVIAVEGAASAIDYAATNCENLAGTGANVDLYNSRIDIRHLRPILAEAGAGMVDVIVLDPPRQGAGQALMEAIATSVARKQIIYIACDPMAAGRDLRVAAEAGWGIDQVRAFDLFPHTHHFETIISLTRA